MIDIDRQIDYWREGAKEDWTVGLELVSSNRTRHGLFFIHLALEKLLKAHVCRHTQDLAPRVHNLVRLSEIAGIDLSETQIDVLAELNAFNLEARYPEFGIPPATLAEAQNYIKRAGEIFEWLTKQL